MYDPISEAEAFNRLKNQTSLSDDALRGGLADLYECQRDGLIVYDVDYHETENGVFLLMKLRHDTDELTLANGSPSVRVDLPD